MQRVQYLQLSMKQLTITNVLAAFTDEPISISERLELLGIGKEEQAKKFSVDVLKVQIYASSFAKFLQDNSSLIDDKIPTDELPDDYKNPFDTDSVKIGDRLSALGLKPDEYEQLFDKKTLDLSISGVEFQDFIISNQDKFLDKLKNLAAQGA